MKETSKDLITLTILILNKIQIHIYNHKLISRKQQIIFNFHMEHKTNIQRL